MFSFSHLLVRDKIEPVENGVLNIQSSSTFKQLAESEQVQGLTEWVWYRHLFLTLDVDRKKLYCIPLPCGRPKHPFQTKSLSNSLNCFPNCTLNKEYPSNVLVVFVAKLLCQHLAFVVLQSGLVSILTFDYQGQTWNHHFDFLLSKNSRSIFLTSAAFDEGFTYLVWCQKTNDESAFTHSLHYRQVALTKMTSVNDLCLEKSVAVKIMSHCPPLQLLNQGSLISCLPTLPQSLDIFLTWSNDTKFSIFNMEGVKLFDSNKEEVDFLCLLSSTIGLWHSEGNHALFQTKNTNHGRIYVLTSQWNLLSFSEKDVEWTKVKLDLALYPGEERVVGFAVYAKIVFVFSLQRMILFNLESGKELKSVLLGECGLVRNVWACSSEVTVFGFTSSEGLFRVSHPDMASMLKECEVSESLYQDEEWIFLSKLNQVIRQKPLSTRTCSSQALASLEMQSPALKLALLQEIRNKTNSCSLRTKDCVDQTSLSNEIVKTKLNHLLSPLEQSFQKLELYRYKLCTD